MDRSATLVILTILFILSLSAAIAGLVIARDDKTRDTKLRTAQWTAVIGGIFSVIFLLSLVFYLEAGGKSKTTTVTGPGGSVTLTHE